MGTSIKTWRDFGSAKIFSSKSLTIQFAKDFEDLFGERLNVGCRKCLQRAYQRINKNNKTKIMNECNYQLKAKYEGIFYKDKPLRNSSLTNKLSEELLKKHKAGKDLFEKMPVANATIKIQDATIKVLKKLYPELISTKKKDILKELTGNGIDIGGEIPTTDDEQ